MDLSVCSWQLQSVVCSCYLWSAQLAELCGLLNCTEEKGCVKCKSFIIRVTDNIYNFEVKTTRDGHLSTVHAFYFKLGVTGITFMIQQCFVIMQEYKNSLKIFLNTSKADIK